MSLIRLQSVSKDYESGPVLRDVHLRLAAGDRIGLVGKNGAGKTTMLRLILGQEEPTSGSVEVDSAIAIGYFSQFDTLDANATVVEVMDAVFAHVHAIEDDLSAIELALGDDPEPDQLDRLLLRQAELFDLMERHDGWNIEVKIDTVLTRLGFSQTYRDRPIRQLSGGWRNRAALAKILLEEPDVLLLDEPTNYLDIAGLEWLEKWLRTFSGAVLLVSHDRHFTDAVVKRIVEIENYHLQIYDGDFGYYVREKQRRFKSLERQFVHEQELLLFEEEAIDDRREARKDPSGALKRKMANIKKQTIPRPVDRIVTDAYGGLVVKQNLCHVEGLSKAYGEQCLFEDLNFDIRREDRIAVVGANGSGKTTLLRMLAGDEPPDSGKILWTKGTEYAYYNQILADLDPADTLQHAVKVFHGPAGLGWSASHKKINQFLGLMQFREMDLKQTIGTLSGGQRARVALAQALLSGASVLILDEPTNHLDVTSTQVMERALVHFPGAVIVVSHDRFFIDKVATRLLVLEGDGVVNTFAGNWTIWQATLEQADG